MPGPGLKLRVEAGFSDFAGLADLQACHEIVSAIEGQILRITGRLVSVATLKYVCRFCGAVDKRKGMLGGWRQSCAA